MKQQKKAKRKVVIKKISILRKFKNYLKIFYKEEN